MSSKTDRDVTLVGDGRAATVSLALVTATRHEIGDRIVERVFKKIKAGELSPSYAFMCWCELFALYEIEKSLTKRARMGQNAGSRLQQAHEENPDG